MADYLSINDIQDALSLNDANFNEMQHIDDSTLYDEKHNEKSKQGIARVAADEDYSKTKDITPSSPSRLPEDVTYPRTLLKDMLSVTEVDDPVKPIEVLMSQEADFMKNMYSIFIMICDKDTYPERAMSAGEPLSPGAEKTSGRDYLYTSPQLNWSIIGMRADGISIPQMKQSYSTIKVAGQTVNKIVGKVETVNKASLSVTLDQSMYILDAFHQLSHDYFAKEKRISDTITAIEGKEFYNAYGALPIHYLESKMNVVDIIVEYDADYLTFTEHEDMNERLSNKKADTRYYPSKANRMQRYVLHDCRFLGRDSSLDFSAQANPMKATFPFVFRRALRTSALGLN